VLDPTTAAVNAKVEKVRVVGWNGIEWGNKEKAFAPLVLS